MPESEQSPNGGFLFVIITPQRPSFAALFHKFLLQRACEHEKRWDRLLSLYDARLQMLRDWQP